MPATGRNTAACAMTNIYPSTLRSNCLIDDCELGYTSAQWNAWFETQEGHDRKMHEKVTSMR